MTLRALAALPLLAAVPMTTWAQAAAAAPPKLNMIAIAMFLVFVVISLGITFWAALRTKSTSDF